jgi:tetratricopeptide (TPR) repeat protein
MKTLDPKKFMLIVLFGSLASGSPGWSETPPAVGLVVSGPGGERKTSVAWRIVDVEDMRNRTHVMGKVMDPSGSPVAGAVIRTERVDATWSTPLIQTTGADGSFYVTNLMPGNYQLSVSADSYQSWSIFLGASQNNSLRLDVSMKPNPEMGTGPSGDLGYCKIQFQEKQDLTFEAATFILQGQVMNLAKLVIPGAILLITGPDIPGFEPRSVICDTDGKFRALDLPMGEYQIEIQAREHRPLLHILNVESCGTFSVDCFLAANSRRETLLESLALGQESLNRAQGFLDQKRPFEAIPLMETSLSDLAEVEAKARGHKLHEDLLALHHHLEGVYATALFEAGKQDEGRRLELWARAEPLLENAANRDPSIDRPWKLLVEIAENRKDAPAARMFRHAQQKTEALITPERYNRALKAYKAHRYTAARTELLEALEESPGQAEVHYLVGLTEIQLGHRAEALKAFRRYLECAPEGARARSVRAFVRTNASKPKSGTKQGGRS